MAFVFLNPGSLRDGDLTLRLRQTTAPDPERDWPPTYQFEMIQAWTGRHLGDCDLRVGNNHRILMYAGHIGYTVEPPHRGRRYAARSVALLVRLARRHEMSTLWITCDPDNAASRRTCELTGAELVEIVDVPRDDEIYREGSRQKCRYRLPVEDEGKQLPQ